MRIAAACFLVVALGMASLAAQDAPKAKVASIVCLFEDDADAMLKLLTNIGDAGGNGEADKADVFSGKDSLKITQYQRFQRQLPNWNFAIREKPKAGEYRYLRFAWKSTGGNGLMLQLHDARDWNIRYTAGANAHGWAAKSLADKASLTWELVTIDLFKDFGERELTGIAFTISGGPGNFDHVYLGRTLDDLDRIDVDGWTGKVLTLAEAELNQLWEDLSAPDDARSHRAFRKLLAGPEASVPFLKRKLMPIVAKGPADQQLRTWIRLLDSESFKERDKASAELKKNLTAATPLLEAELARKPSAELRRRIETLLASRPNMDRDKQRLEKARRVLQLAEV